MSSLQERAVPPADDTMAPAPQKHFVCVHGHFYQPPRDNPWLETVELQLSASPFHDWNERITAECYAPNGASRITNKQGQITRIFVGPDTSKAKLQSSVSELKSISGLNGVVKAYSAR